MRPGCLRLLVVGGSLAKPHWKVLAHAAITQSLSSSNLHSLEKQTVFDLLDRCFPKICAFVLLFFPNTERLCEHSAKVRFRLKTFFLLRLSGSRPEGHWPAAEEGHGSCSYIPWAGRIVCCLSNIFTPTRNSAYLMTGQSTHGADKPNTDAREVGNASSRRSC